MWCFSYFTSFYLSSYFACDLNFEYNWFLRTFMAPTDLELVRLQDLSGLPSLPKIVARAHL